MEKAEWDISTCSVVSRRKDRAKEEMNCGTADELARGAGEGAGAGGGGREWRGRTRIE